MDDRKKLLEQFSKNVKEGLPFAEEFIDGDSDIENNALLARNLSEDALANEVLKNTGVPIPGKTASKSQMEDFYHRLMKERYPELTPNILTGNLKAENSAGWYNPVFNNIALDENLHKERGLPRAVGTLFHEAGHQYDDKMRVVNPGENIRHMSQELDLGTLRKARDSGLDLKKMDPAEVYEMYAKNHHANIPNLREGSFGLGALKSYLKSGTFKALPIIGTAAAVGTALSAPDASAAVGDAIVPGGLESLGPSDEDKAIENPQVSPEMRRQALMKMGQK